MHVFLAYYNAHIFSNEKLRWRILISSSRNPKSWSTKQVPGTPSAYPAFWISSRLNQSIKINEQRDAKRGREFQLETLPVDVHNCSIICFCKFGPAYKMQRGKIGFQGRPVITSKLLAINSAMTAKRTSESLSKKKKFLENVQRASG